MQMIIDDLRYDKKIGENPPKIYETVDEHLWFTKVDEHSWE